MNKKELIEQLTIKAKDCSKAEAGRMLDVFIKIVKDVLKKGDKVAIAGFGSFLVKKRAARAGVNPKTGSKLQIPAMKVPKFKAGQAFKAAVR